MFSGSVNHPKLHPEELNILIIFLPEQLSIPDLFDAARIAHAEVLPVGEVTHNPLGGSHAELVHVEDAALGHQPFYRRRSRKVNMSFWRGG